MKKAAALALSLAMALALCVPSFAETQHMSNFVSKNTYRHPYSDVWSGAWYADPVKTCYEYGLMTGTSDGFNPTGQLTVAEALVIADRVHEIYTTGESTLTNGSLWYQPYVDYALENGLIQAGDFTDYTKPAIRAEVAYIFAHALPPAELYAINDIDHLPDVPMGKYYYSILLLYNAGVLTGTGLTCDFRPNSTITRAETAAIAARMAVAKERKTYVLYDAVDCGGVIPGLTVYLPLGNREDGADAIHLTSASGLYACAVSAREDSAGDITALTKAEGKNGLAESLAAAGYAMDISSVSAADAAFGNVNAYRYQFKAADSDGNERTCIGFTWIDQGRFCTVSFLALQDNAEFRTAIDAMTLS